MSPRTPTLWVGAIAALIVGITVAGVSRWGLADRQPSRRHDVMLLYVGAEDCAPCRTWQRGAGAAFHLAPEFAQLTYREVKSPSLLDVLKDEHWSEDLRGYRDQLGKGAGVPLWLVISDREIVERGFGASQWASAVLPKLKSLLR